MSAAETGYRAGPRERELLPPGTAGLSLEPLRGIAKIEADWRDLEQRAAPRFFLSWTWIGCWLRSLPPDIRPWVLYLRDGSDIVGLALLTRRRARRFGILRIGQWCLHETGDTQLDALTIEDNGILLAPDRAVLAAPALRWLLDNAPGCGELVLGGIGPDLKGAALRAAGDRFIPRAPQDSVRPYVDLDKVRARDGDHLALLGRSTRQAVRRAMRLYERSGPLQFHIAADIGEALEYFARLKDRHQEYWTRRGKPGAFAAPRFEAFHRRLIQESFATGAIQLCRVSAGAREVGYLYNFSWRRWTHAYQSGFAYADDNRLKPGLVSHCLAIQNALQSGGRVYDFMAGDGQYKRSLSTDIGHMTWLVLTANRLPWTIEHAARRLKRRLFEKHNCESRPETMQRDRQP